MQTTRCIRTFCRFAQHRRDIIERKLLVAEKRCLHKGNSYCTAPLAAPHVEGSEREFHPKIQTIVDDISKLTLLEVAELNDLLKKTLNIQDAPMMAMGAMPSAPKEEEEEEAPKKKMSFSVKLIRFEDGKKIQLIKEMKTLVEGMNLVQAKKFVESAPQLVRADLTKDDAEKLKDTITAAGGIVEIE